MPLCLYHNYTWDSRDTWTEHEPGVEIEVTIADA